MMGSPLFPLHVAPRRKGIGGYHKRKAHIKPLRIRHSNLEVIKLAHESVYFNVSKDVGLHDTSLLKRALDSLPGVNSVSIDKGSGRIAVDYDDTGVTRNEIQEKIEILGYPIK